MDESIRFCFGFFVIFIWRNQLDTFELYKYPHFLEILITFSFSSEWQHFSSCIQAVGQSNDCWKLRNDFTIIWLKIARKFGNRTQNQINSLSISYTEKNHCKRKHMKNNHVICVLKKLLIKLWACAESMTANNCCLIWVFIRDEGANSFIQIAEKSGLCSTTPIHNYSSNKSIKQRKQWGCHLHLLGWWY